MKKLLQWILIPIILLLGSNRLSACHGSPLLNYVFTINATNITITANSDPATCGCGPYYMEVQLSCTPTFTGTSPACTSPTWNTFPWYHALLNVPGYSAPNWTENCILEPYSPVVIPFSGLCPGQQYWVRSREMVCGSLSAGAWSPINTFIVPGASAPVLSINASTLTVCPPGCANLTSNIVGGCPTSWTYSWSGGLGTSANAVACPAVSTTYTLTATPVCGLPLTQTVTINVVPPAVSGIASISTSSICAGQTVSLNLVGSSGTIQWQSGPTSIGPWSNIPGATSSTYTSGPLTINTCYQAVVSGCTVANSNVVCVTVNPIPIVTINPIPAICIGQSSTLTASGASTYTWAPGGQTTQSITVSPTISTSYTVTGTSLGCTSSATATLTVNPLPIVNTGTDIISCTAPVNLTSTAGFATYLWTGPVSNPNISNPTTSTTGSYIVTVTDINGCMNSDTVNVNITPVPQISVSVTDPLCFGGIGSATATTGFNTYTWSSSGNTTNIETGLLAGNYSVIGTIGPGCTSSTTFTITQPTQVVINTINSTPVTCNGGSNGTASVLASGGTGLISYIWNPGSISGSSITGLPPQTYTVTATDVNGCTVTGTVNVTEPSLLSLNMSQIPSNCGMPNGSATVTPLGGTPGYTYSWSTSATTSTINGLINGSYNVTVTDANGCTQIGLINVALIPSAITTTAIASDVTCFGLCNGSINLSAPSGGTAPYTYLWSNGQITQNATGLCPGTYSVIVTDNIGCTFQLSGLVITQPTQISTLPSSTPGTICIGQTSNLFSNSSGGTAPYTYLWSNTSVTQNISVSPIITTNYTVTVTDNNGCSITGTTTVNVNPPLSGSASSSPTTICFGDNSTLTSTATGGNGGPYNFTWSPGGAGQTISVSPSNTTTYTVTISDGCSPNVTYTTTVNVNQLPVITYSTTGLTGCEPLTVTYSNTTPNSVSCTWTINSIQYNNCAVTETFPTQGTYNASLTVTDNNGCINTSSIVVATVYPMPIAQFSTDPSIANILEPSIQFNNLSSVGSYDWSFGDGNTSNMFSPSHSYGDTGTYNIQLIVTTQYGCTDTTYGTIIISDIFSVYVPNAFTPNGDGKNDYFTPVVTGAEYYEFLIFNRWGEMIYNSGKSGTPWNGEYKSTLSKDDVYVWKLHIKEKNSARVHDLIGHVTIVK